jgi:hypothetical protein
MARTYKRDSRGRFAGGGGGGSKSKGGSTRSANTARSKELQAKGTTAIGGRVKAKGFSGQKAAQQRAGGLRATNTKGLKTKGTGAGAGTRAGMKASAAQAGKSRSKAASKGTKKMSKAPVSAAKTRYKELSGRARQSSPFRSAADNRKAAGAKRSLATMIKKRGR